MVPPLATWALKFLMMTSNVQNKSCFPFVPPDLQAERAAVSSCCKEVTLPLKAREAERATSGQVWEMSRMLTVQVSLLTMEKPQSQFKTIGVTAVVTSCLSCDTSASCFLVSHPIL